MKKFSFIGSLLLLAAVVTFLFIGCQKESAAVADEEETIAANEGVIKGTDGGSYTAISGLISEEIASQMAAEYIKTFPNANTTSVRYATKDLIAFLKQLNTKFKADSVYVTFGVYNKKTAHTPKQIGRTTVFFMGNGKVVGPSNSGKSGNAIRDLEEASNFLNQGGLTP